MTTTTNNIKRLSELIQEISVCMMTTADDEGMLYSKPMATLDAKFDGNLWFFTKQNSLQAEKFPKDVKVNLAYSNPAKNKYVSVAGLANLVRDRKKCEELWNPLFKAWVPLGLEDPDLVLICTKVLQADYWDAPSSTVVQLFGIAKAYATGHEYDAGEHGHIQLS